MEGKVSAATYELPYSDAEFDLVFLASVFTHLVPAEVQNYTKEIARLLKSGGRVLATVILLNPTSIRDVKSGKAAIAFPVEKDSYRLRDESNPALGIAHKEEFIRRTFQDHGLNICEMSFGTWSGNHDLLNALPDIVIAIKG